MALRAIVFVGGICYAIGATLVLAYGGLVGPMLTLAQLSLAPAAVVFWILASLTRAGDRWTLAYIGIWALEALVVSIGSALFW